MTEVRQDAQKSPTRPEEGELEFESGWSDFTPANQHGESRRQMMPAVHPVKRDHGMIRIAVDSRWSGSGAAANTDAYAITER